jgi:hypothetical protein
VEQRQALRVSATIRANSRKEKRKTIAYRIDEFKMRAEFD